MMEKPRLDKLARLEMARTDILFCKQSTGFTWPFIAKTIGTTHPVLRNFIVGRRGLTDTQLGRLEKLVRAMNNLIIEIRLIQ